MGRSEGEQCQGLVNWVFTVSPIKPIYHGEIMLFTEGYRAQQRELHKLHTYGVKAIQYAGPIKMLIDAYKCESILDYGCGPHQRLKDHIGIKYTPYDIVEPFYHKPKPHDLVAAVDVLEHIEPECITDVLEHIASLAKKAVFLSVHTSDAKKTLPDGRNAHLIQMPMEMWFHPIAQHFDIQQLMRVSDREFFICAAAKDSS